MQSGRAVERLGLKHKAKVLQFRLVNWRTICTLGAQQKRRAKSRDNNFVISSKAFKYQENSLRTCELY